MSRNDVAEREVSFDLGDLFAFFWLKKWAIMLTTLLFMALGYLYVASLPRLYSASSTLLLGDEGGALPIASMAALTGKSSSKMDTHIEFIRSRTFLRDIVDTLALQNEPEFFPTSGPGAGQPDAAHAVSVIQEDLTLSVIANTDMLRVSFIARDPLLAMKVANAIGPAFFATQMAREQGKVATTSQWLNQQIDAARRSLDATEQELQVFLEENQLVDVRSEMALLQSEIVALMREKLAAEKQFSELNANLLQLNSAGGNVAAMMQVPWVMANDYVRSLRSQVQRQRLSLDELAKRYKAKHYKYVAAQSTLDQLEAELSDTVLRLQDGLAKQTNSLEDRIDDVTNQISAARERHTSMGNLDVQLARLKREVELSQQQYDIFLSRLQEAEVLQDVGRQQNFSVIDAARLPERPVSPRVTLAMAVITLLSLLFSTAIWLVIHLLSDKRARVRQTLAGLQVPVLAEIPRQSRKDEKRLLRKQHAATQQYDEAIRTLRTSLIVKQNHRANRCLMFTSVNPSDGKNRIVADLAESFSHIEKALLVDADLREPAASNWFDEPHYYGGLVELVNGYARFSDCVVRPAGSTLTILPAGAQPGDPIQVLSKPRLKALMTKLGVFYERLLLNSAPLSGVSDSLLLAKMVDGVVLVCDIERTEISTLNDSISQLQDSGAIIAGVVLNGVKPSRKRRKLIRPLSADKREQPQAALI